MKNYLYIFLISIAFISCSDQDSNNLQGEWHYEREVTSTIEPIINNDTAGTLVLRSNGIGNWDSSNGFHSYELEWAMENGCQDVVIKLSGAWLIDTRTYNINRIDEDNFIISATIKKVSGANSTLETVEKITLKRL